MRRFQCTLLATVALIGFASIASAADMPVKAPDYKAPVAAQYYDWTGFYVGAHIGYLWGHTEIDEADTGALAALGPTNGVVGGLLGGANWQTGLFVFGGEADIGWSDAKGNGAAPPPATEFFNYDIRSTSHFRGRVGYDFNKTLFYLAGGLAIAEAHVQEVTNVIATGGGTYLGWSIGGGIDYAITHNLVGRIEYLYDDYGHKDYTGVSGDMYRVSLTGQTLRGALIWKFDPTGMRP